MREELDMGYQIWNRRYTGSKYKLVDWISQLVSEQCEGMSFCDMFAGTAVIAKRMLDFYDTVYINDLLYSNEIIYRAFFEQSEYSGTKLEKLKKEFAELDSEQIPENYVSENYGDKFFSRKDSLIIWIRIIPLMKKKKILWFLHYCIQLIKQLIQLGIMMLI
jgi:adenine-specific DNA-methyltransferase